MIEILIANPIQINLELLETDSYFLSMKTLIDVKLTHPSGFFIYQANDIWLDCKKWDEFNVELDQIVQSNSGIARLADMSDYLSLILRKEDNMVSIEFQVVESDIVNGSSIMKFNKVIDNEILAQIRNKVNSFIRWWK